MTVHPSSVGAPPHIAVILPCYNEAAAISGVIEAFRSALPRAEIFVIDNASTDGTANTARAAGATVISRAAATPVATAREPTAVIW